MSGRRSNFSVKKIREVFEKTNGTCFYCKVVLPKNSDFYDESGKVVVSRRNWDIEHIIPLFEGGSNNDENLVASCIVCHRKKTKEERKKWKTDGKRKGVSLFCERCGNNFTAQRNSKFCSSACKQAEYRERKLNNE